MNLRLSSSEVWEKALRAADGRTVADYEESRANGRKRSRTVSIRLYPPNGWPSTSAETDRTIVKCIGLGFQRDPRSDWPGLIIKPLGGAWSGRGKAGGEVHLCDGNRDRSRMQTTLKRVTRRNGNGHARAAWYARRGARHMCRFPDTVYVSAPGPPSTWPITEKRASLQPDSERFFRFALRPELRNRLLYAPIAIPETSCQVILSSCSSPSFHGDSFFFAWWGESPFVYTHVWTRYDGSQAQRLIWNVPSER